jgi:Tol biopolymer transport system component
MRRTMPAAIFLETSHLEVDPGRDVSATVTVRNTGTIVDEFRFDLVGVPAAWGTVTPPAISLFPGTGGAVQVRFAPPRDASVPPTTETFGIRVRSTADPTFSFVEEGDLTVRPFAQLAARIVPRSSRASLLRRRARHRLVVENTGNAALVVEAAAADPDERLDLSVVPPAVTVNPGGSATLLVAARARERLISGQARTLQFVVAAAPAAGSPPTALLTPGGPVPAPPRPLGRLDPLLPGTSSLLRLDGSVVVRPLLAFGLPQLAAVAVPLALVAVVALGGLGRGSAAPTLQPSASAPAPAESASAPVAVVSPTPTETVTDSPTVVTDSPTAVTESPTPSPTSSAETVSPSPAPPSVIAFETVRDGNLDVLVVSPDRGTQTPVAASPSNEMYPAVSPDGTQVAYMVEGQDTSDIYVTQIATNATRRLTQDAGRNSQPAWSPDGTRLVFASDRGGTVDLYTMNADGSRQRRLLDAPTLGEGGPTWSPDGGTIVFSASTANPDGTGRPAALYSVPADGGQPARLTDETGADRPEWSPDGTLVAFDAPSDDPNGSIFVMRADGSDVTRITPAGWGGAIDPTWSRDGTEIAFARYGGGSGAGIWIEPSGGGTPTPVEGTEGADMPSWH